MLRLNLYIKVYSSYVSAIELNKYILTIVTAVHNNLSGLEKIYNDLYPLLNGKLQWVIKDSGYSQGIIEWHKILNKKDITLLSSNDFGIYDALNTALKHVHADHYLVIGSDDRVIGNHLLFFLDFLENGKYLNVDLISFPVQIGNKYYGHRAYIPLSWSISSLIASHSCGLVIKLSVHNKLGLYSTKYRILSDSLLILRAYKAGCKLHYENFPIGIFSIDGISSRLTIQRAKEAFKYNLEAGSPFLLQLLFFSVRILFFIIKSLICAIKHAMNKL